MNVATPHDVWKKQVTPRLGSSQLLTALPSLPNVSVTSSTLPLPLRVHLGCRLVA